MSIGIRSTNGKDVAKWLRFAEFIRVSTERQKDRGESLRTQDRQIREAVAALGGEITKTYSGQQHATPGYEHRLLDELLRDAATDSFDAVMVSEASRWSRDNRKNKEALSILRKNHIRFFTGSTEHDLRSPQAWFALGVLSEVNEFVAGTTNLSSIQNRIDRAKRGWLMTGTAPYGRRIANLSNSKDAKAGHAQWEVIPEDQERILRAYGMYVEERKTFQQVAPLVGMSAETLRRRLLFGCRDKLVQHFRSRDGTIDEAVDTPLPALLSQEQIAAVAARAKDNQVHRTIEHEYPLAHLVRCHCGSVLSGQGNLRKSGKVMRSYRHFKLKGNPLHPQCTSFVRADDLERAVFGQIGDLLKNQAMLRASVEAALAERDGAQHHARRDLEAAEAEHRRLTREQGKLIDSLTRFEIAEGSPMHGEMKQRIDRNNRKLSEIEQRRVKLEQAAQSTVIPSDLHDRVRAALFHLIGMNGVAPAGWPAAAQKELAQFFFGTTVKRDPDRGVFVRLRQHAGLGRYWTYEARGLIGVGRGALSDYVYLHDVHDAIETKRAIEPGEGAELARIATGLRDMPAPARRGTLKCPARVSIRTCSIAEAVAS